MRSTWFFWFRNMFLPSHGKSFISQSALLRKDSTKCSTNNCETPSSGKEETIWKSKDPKDASNHYHLKPSRAIGHLLWQSYTWSHLITFDPSFLSATARISLLKRSASFCAILRNGGWWEQRFKRDSKREAVPIWIGVPQKWIVYTGKPYYPIDDLGVPLIRIDDLGAHPYFWKTSKYIPPSFHFWLSPHLRTRHDRRRRCDDRAWRPWPHLWAPSTLEGHLASWSHLHPSWDQPRADMDGSNGGPTMFFKKLTSKQIQINTVTVYIYNWYNCIFEGRNSEFFWSAKIAALGRGNHQ